MGKKINKVLSLTLAGILCMGVPINTAAVTMEEAKDKANKLEEQKNAVEAEKETLAKKLQKIITDMEETEKKLSDKEKEVEQIENELVQAKVDADNQYESMKVRIKFMYEGGNTQFLEMLVDSKNMGDFLNKAEYVSRVSEYDRKELTKYQDTVKEVEKKEEQVHKEYEELNVLQSKLVEQQSEVQTMIADNEEKLADIQSEISANAETLDRLKKEAEEAKRRQEEQAQAQAQAQAQNNQNRPSNQGSSNNNYTPPSSGGNVVSGNGYFTHPCPGMSYQSSYFGEIRPFESGGHKGHDYAAPTGTPTYAAAAGTVIIAGYSSSAGNWVVINHGNGLTTKYMHHSALCVSAGQYVEKGQQIGYVGSTGQSTGPHLHFQVELNHVPVNPDLYM